MAASSGTAGPAAPVGSGSFASTLGALLRTRESTVIGALVVSILTASLLVDSFATARNAGYLLLDVAAIAMIALPMTLVVISAEIDLSVASTLGLSSAVMGHLWTAGLPLETVVVLCLLLGAFLGAVNGVLVTVAGLPSLAVTIGTMAAYRGLAYVVLGDRAVTDFPLSWSTAVTGRVPGTEIPWIGLVLLVLAAAFGVLLHATPIGRGLYAVGANPEAARFAGMSVRWAKLWMFVLTGTVAALAGVYWTLRYGSARADNGFALELSVVAAVLLGGVSIFGGRGSLPGVIAGVLLFGSISNALRLASVPEEALVAVTGLLLIVSVVVPNLAGRIREYRAQRARARVAATHPANTTRTEQPPGGPHA